MLVDLHYREPAHDIATLATVPMLRMPRIFERAGTSRLFLETVSSVWLIRVSRGFCRRGREIYLLNNDSQFMGGGNNSLGEL